ncbi:MAG TPA: hypothetical protein P5161_02765, partial [Eubacteriales bacterium]|nr:hypothetical protein [Eubacteriales bacterium]
MVVLLTIIAILVAASAALLLKTPLHLFQLNCYRFSEGKIFSSKRVIRQFLISASVLAAAALL